MAKVGPNGLYAKLAKDLGPEYPQGGKPWRKLSKTARNRLHDLRAIWRRRNHREKYQRLGKWVRGIRHRMNKSQSEFAELVGVSRVTIKRWEGGYGHEPAPVRMKVLKQLADTCKAFKKAGAPLE